MILPVLVVLLLQEPQSARLQLSCGGAGAANKTTTATASAYDSNGGSAYVTAQGSRSEGFADQVDLWVEGAEGRIRLPRIMLPIVHGGDGGWFKLKDIRVTDDTIDASAAVNFMNNPKVHIDRRTGSISIDGKAGHYSGECERVDPASQPRRF